MILAIAQNTYLTEVLIHLTKFRLSTLGWQMNTISRHSPGPLFQILHDPYIPPNGELRERCARYSVRRQGHIRIRLTFQQGISIGRSDLKRFLKRCWLYILQKTFKIISKRRMVDADEDAATHPIKCDIQFHIFDRSNRARRVLVQGSHAISNSTSLGPYSSTMPRALWWS
jgi:hypothetical protein